MNATNSTNADGERNPFDALRRRWAARGVSLVELSDGTLLAGGVHLPSLHAASRALRLIGGAA